MKLNDSAIKVGIVLQCLGVVTILVWWATSFTGCNSREAIAQTEQAVVSINQLQLTGQDLQAELVHAQLTPHDLIDSDLHEPGWLSYLIERELLVQQAKTLRLDREPEFMRTIERFWKEALIKQLIEQKGREIRARINVFEPEIEKRFEEHSKEVTGGATEPLAVLRDEIQREIRQEKETEAMEKWLSELRQGASIQVNQEAIARIQKP